MVDQLVVVVTEAWYTGQDQLCMQLSWNVAFDCDLAAACMPVATVFCEQAMPVLCGSERTDYGLQDGD